MPAVSSERKEPQEPAYSNDLRPVGSAPRTTVGVRPMFVSRICSISNEVGMVACPCGRCTGARWPRRMSRNCLLLGLACRSSSSFHRSASHLHLRMVRKYIGMPYGDQRLSRALVPPMLRSCAKSPTKQSAGRRFAANQSQLADFVNNDQVVRRHQVQRFRLRAVQGEHAMDRVDVCIWEPLSVACRLASAAIEATCPRTSSAARLNPLSACGSRMNPKSSRGRARSLLTSLAQSTAEKRQLPSGGTLSCSDAAIVALPAFGQAS